MELAGMKPGDHAGLVALQSHFGTVGVQVADNGDRYVTMCVQRNGEEEALDRIRYEGESIYLRIDFDFVDNIDLATFYYSDNGETWNPIGRPLQMKYTLDHFMGYRIGLFNYATKRSGGIVDFDYFRFTKADC